MCPADFEVGGRELRTQFCWGGGGLEVGCLPSGCKALGLNFSTANNKSKTMATFPQNLKAHFGDNLLPLNHYEMNGLVFFLGK